MHNLQNEKSHELVKWTHGLLPLDNKILYGLQNDPMIDW